MEGQARHREETRIHADQRHDPRRQRANEGGQEIDGEVPGHAADGIRADEGQGILGGAEGEEDMLRSERLKEDLGNRWEEFLEDLAKILPSLVDNMVSIADKYGVKRDDVVFLFAQTLYKLSTVSTFERWEEEQ